MITAPESMANKTYTEVLDTMIQWTNEFRDKFQEEIRYDDQIAICGMAGRFFLTGDTIKYPNITEEYTPMNECPLVKVPDDECDPTNDECAPIDGNVPGIANKQVVIRSVLYIMACIFAIIS